MKDLLKNMFKSNMPEDLYRLFICVGAGFNQIPLIKEARRQGFHVIGIDQNSRAAGFIDCDIRIQESIENRLEIFDKLSELMINGDIKGVLSRSYGEAIKTACFIADRLNIPLVPLDRIDDFIDKKRMKAVFREYDIPTPPVTIIREMKDVDRLRGPFPKIAKPTTGHAKFGVHLLERKSDFLKTYLSGSESGVCLVEEYVEGDEIISFGIVHNRTYHLVDITDKIKTPHPHFVDLAHLAPSRYEHLATAIASIGQRITDSFGIVNSPLLMELIVNGSEISVIEAAPEFGGECIADWLIQAHTGYNFIGESIRAVSHMEFHPPADRRTRSAVAVKYITGNPGTLASFNPDSPKRVNGVIFSKIFKDIGAEIRRPATNHDRIGVVIARAKTVKLALAAAEQAADAFEIRISEPAGKPA